MNPTLPVRRVLQRTPLRVTLVVALVLLAAIGLTATGLVVTSAIRGYLIGQVDKDLGGLVHRNPPQTTGSGDGDGQGPNPFETSRDEYYAIADRSGKVINNLVGAIGQAQPPHLTAAQLRSAADHGPFTASAAGNGPDWRVQVVRTRLLTSPGTPPLPVIYVRAVSLADVEDTTHQLVVLELIVGAVVLALLAGLSYLVVRTSLRPLKQMETTAAEIAAGDLTQRVPDSDPRTEVGQLSGAFNAMLGQIETAFRAREASESSALASEQRMRRFVADASHELRTPLTSIRGFAELYRQGGVPQGEELDRVMRRVEDEAARMGLLVEDLLLLARLDQQRPIELAPVDLIGVLGDVVHDTRVLAPDREISLSIEGDVAPVVLGDEDRLRQVVTNLVSNAITHTPNGSQVAVGLAVGPGPGPGTALVSVTDHGPGMSEEDRAKVFERFYRADPSRTRAAGGSGLGLSIVAALVAAHGGRVGVQSALGSGSRFLVELPLLDPMEPEPGEDTLAAGSAAGSQVDHRLPGDHVGAPLAAPASESPAPPARHPA
ncbi:MAG TPA: HAMP domain-containing sensor histidine kinase [Actinomycetes bacterium]|nr:HAMP domain-containing sensor histidine kinase [Actinomycetes bacterium]